MIKLPFQIALEEKAALGGEEKRWQTQQKQMSKLFKKHAEALKKLTGTHTADILAVKQQQDSKKLALETSHETVRAKEAQKATQIIEKGVLQFRKKREEIAKELKKTNTKAKKAFEKELKARAAVIKKEMLGNSDVSSGGDKAQLQAIKVNVDAMMSAETADFLETLSRRDESEHQLYEMNFGIAKIQTITLHKKEALALRDEQRGVELALVREQKTGILLQKATEHCFEVNKLHEDHMAQRHALELESLEGTHRNGFGLMQKQQESASKTLRNSLRKLPEEAAEITSLLAHKRNQNPGATDYSTLSRKQIQKSERVERLQVKEGHIKAETLKLSTTQTENMAMQRKRTEDEMGQLRKYHARQKADLKTMHAQAIVALDKQAHSMVEATDKYIATTEKSMAKSSADELTKRIKLETRVASEKQAVIVAAKAFLVETYATQKFQRSSALELIAGTLE
jgi:hypothetical protein